MAENAGGKQPAPKHQQRRRGPGRRWVKGQSGNAAGKKPGTRNKTTLLAQALLDGEASRITHKAIALALKGDPIGLRLCIERLLPVVRHRVVHFSIPPLNSASDAAAAMAAIVAAVAGAELTPDEADALSNLVANFARTLEINEIEARVAALEQHHAQKIPHENTIGPPRFAP